MSSVAAEDNVYGCDTVATVAMTSVATEDMASVAAEDMSSVATEKGTVGPCVHVVVAPKDYAPRLG